MNFKKYHVSRNLFDKSKRTDNFRVLYTTGEIGELYSVFVSDFTPIEPNTTYTLNIVSSISGKTGHLFALYDENKNFVNTGAHEATPATVYTFTTPSNVAYIRFNGNVASVDEIMLNTGSTALPYEPYGNTWTDTPHYIHNTSTDTITTLPAVLYPNAATATVGLKGNTVQNGTPTPDNPIMPQSTGDLETVGEKAGQYKIPISSAGQTNNIYLGEVETTRQIKKLVLTGEENWFINETVSTEDTIYFYTTIIVEGTYKPEYSICSHFEYKDAYSIRNENGYQLLSGYGGLRFRVMRTIATTVADFKSYLAQQYANGTPVTIWYVLATEETAVVNEPLMKISDYADEVSGITIPITAGGDTLSVGTTVQPSEVTVNYKGWHPVADVHERENGQWD